MEKVVTRKRRRPTRRDAARVSAISARNAERVQAKINRVVRLMSDADQSQRMGDRECPACFYLRPTRISGDPVTLEAGSPDMATVDHVVPLSRGGADTVGNMQIAHRRCNQGKADRMPGDESEGGHG